MIYLFIQLLLLHSEYVMGREVHASEHDKLWKA